MPILQYLPPNLLDPKNFDELLIVLVVGVFLLLWGVVKSRDRTYKETVQSQNITFKETLGQILSDHREDRETWGKSTEKISLILENHLGTIGTTLEVVKNELMDSRENLRQHQSVDADSFSQIVTALTAISSSLQLLQGKVLEAALIGKKDPE